MKKIFTILTFLTATSIFATDRFVDPNLSAGNGTTLFTSITSAVNAAVNGDRIIIASTTYNEPELTISKSLQIMPQTPGTTINFNANIIISGFAGMKLEIIGFNLGIYSFNASPIIGGIASNRSKISIINCSSEYLSFDNDYYQVNFIENQITNGIIFRNGNVIKNITKQISLMDEPQDNPNITERNLIIANQVQFLIGVFNNDYPVVVANNSMRDLSFRRWNANENIKNYITNNEFTDNCVLNFSISSVPRYNIIFSSNKFINGFVTASSGNCGLFYQQSYTTLPNSPMSYNEWMPSWNWCCNGPSGWYYINGQNNPTMPPNFMCYGWVSLGSNNFPNINVPGFFDFSYNGLQTAFINPTSGSPLNLTNIQGPANEIDGGNPNHQFYDIDLTINDRGRNGGPYSLLNYNPTSNSNNSKAFIFDLDMPTDLFPGQSIDIKAKGYHKN
ncbi:hypothetical protein [Flavobacterium sp.]|jgi:hypothetical protein|uniref:hypothetical protein n=1 Tax=Flavobacterium sp. TaxID=239 RepID=UPI0037BE78AE